MKGGKGVEKRRGVPYCMALLFPRFKA